MPDITATEAARRFSDLLDSVEHDAVSYTIVRRGRAVAHLEPIARGRGAEVKDLLSRTRPDAAWVEDLAAVRDLLEVDDRS
jgi:prevent-host-death family protein